MLRASLLLVLLCTSFALHADAPTTAPSSLPVVPAGELQRYEDQNTKPLLILSFTGLSSGKTTYTSFDLSLHVQEVGAKDATLHLSYDSPSYPTGCNESTTPFKVNNKALGKFSYASGEKLTDMGGIFYHTAYATLSRKNLSTLAKAQKISGSLCGKSFVLTKQQREAITLLEKALR